VGNGYRAAFLDLLLEQRHNGTAGTQHVAEAHHHKIGIGS